MTNTLGEYIKQRRIHLGLTLRDMEDQTGLSNAYLSQLENGKILKPSLIVLSKLRDGLATTMDTLLFHHGLSDPNKKTCVFDDITPNEEKELRLYLEFMRYKSISQHPVMQEGEFVQWAEDRLPVDDEQPEPKEIFITVKCAVCKTQWNISNRNPLPCPNCTTGTNQSQDLDTHNTNLL